MQKYYNIVSCADNSISIYTGMLSKGKNLKMKILNRLIILMLFTASIVACEENESPTVSETLERDRTEQQVADRDSLLQYLTTHYYNSGTFQAGNDYTYEDIQISELPVDANGDYMDLPDPANNTLLIDAVETHTTVYRDTEYEYYILRINQGGGESPKFTDAIRYRFEGIELEGQSVVQSISSPEILNLQAGVLSSSFGAIRAWQLVIPMFSAAESFTSGFDGVVDFNNYGLGVMFIPSGLGYYSFLVAAIPQYSNLIFKFEVLQYEVVDHDLDGIPSYIEDLNADLFVEDDDTDQDQIPNYGDFNDDGDGVFTINELLPTQYIVDTTIGETEPELASNEYELNRSTVNGIITINTVTAVDSNDDGIPDYLDPEIEINYNESQ
jgi:FKBP-type peptidyl-prolyl cis-trans isomerase FkpA